MVVDWASLQIQTRHLLNWTHLWLRLTSVSIKNDNQRAVQHTWTVIHIIQMVCYIGTELTSCVFCRRM